MSNNCLVTKLKSTVDNSNLEELGVLYTYVRTESESLTDLIIGSNSANSVKVTILDDDITFTSVQATGTLIDSKSVYLPTTAEFPMCYVNKGSLNIHVKIEYKYDISWLYAGQSAVIDLSQFKYYNSLSSLFCDYAANVIGNLSNLNNHNNMLYIIIDNADITGDISSLSNMTKLIRLSLSSCTNLTGDISSLSNMTKINYLSLDSLTNLTGDISSLSNMSSLYFLDVANTNIGGNLSSISNLTNLNNVYIQNSPNITGDISNLSKNINLGTSSSEFAFFSTGIYGTMESLFNGMYANGKTSGVFNYYANSIVTYNGVAQSGRHTATFSADGWTLTS